MNDLAAVSGLNLAIGDSPINDYEVEALLGALPQSMNSPNAAIKVCVLG